MIGIGVILVGYGLLQILNAERIGSEVVFSQRTAKSFLTNNAIILALLLLVIVIMAITLSVTGII